MKKKLIEISRDHGEVVLKATSSWLAGTAVYTRLSEAEAVRVARELDPVPRITAGDEIMIVPERGPARRMRISHVEM